MTASVKDKTVSLRELLRNSYPGSIKLQEFATESVKATGKYPTSCQNSVVPDQVCPPYGTNAQKVCFD